MTIHRTFIAACAVALAARSLAAQQGPLTVGTITAGAGEVVSGYLEVPAGVDSATRIPISVARGARPGPTLALIAGTHGSEVAPVLALQQVRQQLDAAQLSGTVLLVHIANAPSFYGRTIYYSPVDGKNLNRMYPGYDRGTVSERIAATITREIIERADFVVDMHAGDGNESLRPYSYWMPLGVDPRADSISREMGMAFGSEIIVVDSMRSRDARASIYTSNTAMTRGKPAITTENGWLGMPDAAMVERNVRGAFRLLRYFAMLPGQRQMSRPAWVTRTEVLRSPGSGVWHAAVQRDQRVREGELLGWLTDPFGGNRTEIRVPFAGRVLYVMGTPAMNQGEPVGMIGAP